ncbi:MAG: CopG family transcriptional regulator [Oligoflexia bacterium]|nr:CopG family transcriptional regulator [Oligoflexia bacterium]
MKKDKKKIVSIRKIEKEALEGKDVNQYFGNGKRMLPLSAKIQRVNVDFGIRTLEELDEVATELNVGRQAVIKLYIQRELDQHFLAKHARKK